MIDIANGEVEDRTAAPSGHFRGRTVELRPVIGVFHFGFW
jgi:hypothetical protein